MALITELIPGDNICMHSAQIRSRYERNRKAETDTSGLDEWNMRHTALLHETVQFIGSVSYYV